MNTENPAENPAIEPGPEEAISNLFANLIIQQTNMAFMFLGRVPHPETGEVIQDLESARFFIDQLEMIEVKTRGNLDKREEGLLKQSLTGLRMAFVEAMDGKGPAPLESAPSVSPTETAAPIETPAPSEVPAEPKPAPAEESRKKFSKKY